MLNGGEGAEDSGPFAVFNMATASVAMPPACWRMREDEI